MEDNKTSSVSDTETNPSGDTEVGNADAKNADAAADKKADEKVPSYETYKRTVDEAKKEREKRRELEQKLADIDKAQKAKDEERLRKNGDSDKLLAVREKELAEERDRNKQFRGEIEKSLKLDAVLKSLNGELDRQYWKLVELDKIVLDPETGIPDEMSVEQYARDFEKTFSKVLNRRNGTIPPQNAAQGNKKLSYDEWLKLNPKDMRSRMKDVM